MPELPKSVVARLKSRPAPQDHPDADLLAAFAEQALTGRERESVLTHLSACESCREIVALAAPQGPALQPAGILVPWYRRPQTFAWAGTLATFALIGALILNYARSGDRNFEVTDATPAKVATRQVPENQPAAAREQPAPTAPTESAKRAEPQRHDALGKMEGERQKNNPSEESKLRDNAAPAPPAQAASKDEKKLDGGVLQNQYSVMKEAPAAPPSLPPSAPAAKAANVVGDKQQMAEADAVAAERAATRPESANAAVAGAAAGGSLHQSKARMQAAPRWSITAKGRLQRSLDSGRTWQPQLANESTVFRALAVMGNEVWAGGTAATVLHSSDGGGTWARQVLPGAVADVVALQFSDAQHGTARTADGVTWTTSDAGRHWARQ